MNDMTNQSRQTTKRVERWCGICFAWREEHEGRCAICGNAHMRGAGIVRERVAVCSDIGHDFADAGGGLLICVECQAERWADA